MGVVEDNVALLGALRRRVPTAEVKGRRYVSGVDWRAVRSRGRERRERLDRGTELLPGLSSADLAALRRRYAPERASLPAEHRATFQAPIDLSEPAFAALRLRSVKAFVDALEKQGYRLCTDRPIRITAGPYPAYDLRDGAPRLDRREYRITASFTFPNPKPVRLELPPWATEPVRATA